MKQNIQLASLAPSIEKLESILRSENRSLTSDDIQLVRNICNELAQNKENLQRFFSTANYLIESVAYMERIKLYKSDEIEIRVHLFYDDENEPYIHQHGQYFITTCLSGAYTHSVYSKTESDQSYYVFIRGQNGIFNQTCSKVCKGTLEPILVHEFKMGQSLFLSPYPYHTVVQSSGPLITIVVRSSKDTIDNVEFIHSKEKLSNIPKVAIKIEDSININKIVKRFIDALENFSQLNL